MRILVRSLCLFGLAACSSSSTSSNAGGGTCAPRSSGTYVTSYTTRSGNCGNLPVTVVAAAPDAGVPAGCTGLDETSSNGCTAIIDVTCPTSFGGTQHRTGTTTWTSDAASGSGVLGVTTLDPSGAVVCTGSYDSSARRQ